MKQISKLHVQLCIIATNKNLKGKAEQFCKKGNINQECGFSYFQALIANNKIVDAFIQQYAVFFSFPFAHNKMLNQSLTKIKDHLKNHQINLGKAQKQGEKNAPSFESAIIKLYLDKPAEGLSQLQAYLKKIQDKQVLIYEHFLYLRLLHKQNQLYDALKYVEEVVSQAKSPHPYFHHLHGNFLMHIIQFKKAIAQFDKANEGFKKLYNTANGFSFTNYNIGICYEKVNEFKNAIKFYEKAVIDSNSAQSLNALGHSYEQLYQVEKNQDYLDKTQIYYKKSLEVNENYTIALYNYGVYELKEKSKTKSKSIDKFIKCIQVDPEFKTCQYALIKAYYLSENVPKADEIINRIQKSQANLAELCALLYSIGDSKKALKLINNNIETIKSAILMEVKGMCEFAQQKYKQAEESFAKSIYLGSKSGYIYFNLGMSLQYQQKYEESWNAYKTAYKLDKRPESLSKAIEVEKKIKKPQQL